MLLILFYAVVGFRASRRNNKHASYWHIFAGAVACEIVAQLLGAINGIHYWEPGFNPGIAGVAFALRIVGLILLGYNRKLGKVHTVSDDMILRV